jgi:hypothetical protein
MPQPFISDTFSGNSTEEFKKLLLDAEINSLSAFNKAATPSTKNLYSLNQLLQKSDGTIFYLPSRGLYGNCDVSKGVQFLESIPDQKCGSKVSISKTNAGAISVPSILSGTFLSSLIFSGSEGSPITVKAGLIWNVEFNKDTTAATHRTITTLVSSFLTPSVSTHVTTCDYNNLIKEIHYTAFVSDSTKISSITADVVYMNLVGESCTVAFSIMVEQVISFKFKDNADS